MINSGIQRSRGKRRRMTLRERNTAAGMQGSLLEAAMEGAGLSQQWMYARAIAKANHLGFGGEGVGQNEDQAMGDGENGAEAGGSGADEPLGLTEEELLAENPNDSITMVGAELYLCGATLVPRALLSLNIACVVAVAEEEKVPKSSRVGQREFQRISVADDHHADLSEKMGWFAEKVEEVAGAGAGATLVHCQLGRSRSVALAAAWLVRKGNSADEAVARINRIRKDPLLNKKSLKREFPLPANKRFVRQLLDYEQSLVQKRQQERLRTLEIRKRYRR